MQSFKTLVTRSNYNKHRGFEASSFTRNLCTVLSSTKNYDNSVLVEERVGSRTVILNRPQLLNALTTPMVVSFSPFSIPFQKRAFCSGGDVVKVYHLLNEGRVEECKEFFRTFYSFMHLLGTYSKPHVALLDGITMGGGAGISVHGSHRIATDKTVFGIPEVGIGFHPDAGASYYLSRLPAYLVDSFCHSGRGCFPYLGFLPR
ncbi:Crotonase superfamily [Corchorus olitorius]|uniref:3-hydroxyisobutyryl-CoA hydrolase n=1 Tax=Corchorus olitorius TaxID=93759 RepID=A0A1R3G320_9ROSI|nr:Crotonase superfamily [Corchorus olitorius]